MSGWPDLIHSEFICSCNHWFVTYNYHRYIFPLSPTYCFIKIIKLSQIDYAVNSRTLWHCLIFTRSNLCYFDCLYCTRSLKKDKFLETIVNDYFKQFKLEVYILKVAQIPGISVHEFCILFESYIQWLVL